MKLHFSSVVELTDSSALGALYGSPDAYGLFSDSYAKCLARSGTALVGAVRVISEGVETALLVDLATIWDGDEGTETEKGSKKENITASLAFETKVALLSEIEKELIGRRVMAIGSRKDLEVFEKAGYGRCKNAWTLYRSGMDDKDFLPCAYRYENEFLDDTAENGAAKKGSNGNAAGFKPKNIIYRDGLGEASFAEVNRLLTDAFWGRPHDENRTRTAFTNSRYTVSAFDGDKLVGVARAVADGSRYATILNVAVDPGYQGLSIGKSLIRRLEGNITEKTVVLNTHPGAVGFYNRLTELRRSRYIFERHVDDPSAPARGPQNHGFREKMFTPAGYRFPDEY